MYHCLRSILDHKLAALVVLLAAAVLTQMPTWLRWMALGAATSGLLFALAPLLFRGPRVRRLMTLHDLRALFSQFTKSKSDDIFEEADEFQVRQLVWPFVLLFSWVGGA